MKIGLVGAAQSMVAGLGGPAEIRAVVAPKTVVQAYPARLPVFAHTEVEYAMQALSYLEAGLTAASQNCHALVLNSLSDYGLAALKSAVELPVVGAAEASLRFMPSLGPRFSIVTVWPETTNFMPRRMLEAYGAAAHCIRIRNVGSADLLAGEGRPDDFLRDMQTGQQAILDRIVAQCEAAMAEDDIDAILLGCTCMSPIAARIAARVAIPVVNPLAIAVKTAEMQASHGLRASRRGQGAPRPASLDLLRRMIAPVAGAEPDCPVCVVAAAK